MNKKTEIGIFTKSLITYELGSDKYLMFLDMAESIRDFKNDLSRHVSSNLYVFLNMKAYQFITYVRNTFPGRISPLFDKQAAEDVYTSYQNKFDAIQRHLTFDKIIFKGFEFYKRDCKNGKKGDLKKVDTERKKTSLSIFLTYLARYGSPITPEYISVQLESGELSDNKRKYYEDILRCFEKFTFERLYALAMSKRDRIIRYYNRKPIEFKSLTFRARSRKKAIVGENKNEHSIISHFVNLSWPGCEGLSIPILWSDSYHGATDDYLKATNDYEYTVTFPKKRKEVCINIAVKGEREVVCVDDNDKVVGIDCNVKHNLFCLSDGKEFDFDRGLLGEFMRHQRRTDELKKLDKRYKVGKERKRVEDAMSVQMLNSIRMVISDVCKYLQSQGVSHIVMEDLGTFGASDVKIDELGGVKINRVLRFLHFSDLKNEVKHIAVKYGIAVSFVPSHYTSKMCPKCGTIADENRLTQEEFCCVNCGHSDNADHNAAVNIKNRVSSAVRLKLLEKNGDGTYSSKKGLKKESIKRYLQFPFAVHGERIPSNAS